MDTWPTKRLFNYLIIINMNYVNIKISNADLPKPFIVMNDWMNKDRIRHGEANGYCAVSKKYSCYGKNYNDMYHDIDIHGWLTLSESLADCKEWFPHIYNAYLQLEWTHADDDVRIFWFDTAHPWDTKAERDKDAVEREARYLQKQLLQFYVPTKEEWREAQARQDY